MQYDLSRQKKTERRKSPYSDGEKLTVNSFSFLSEMQKYDVTCDIPSNMLLP